MNRFQGLDKKDRATLLIEYWKQSTQVQQHFNDVSMKVRNFAVVVFSAFLTGVGLSIHNGIFLEVLGCKFNAAVLFALVGMFVTQLIHFMDTYWYHVFLKSAVSETLKLESEIKSVLKIESLSGAISVGSQKVEVASLFGQLPLPFSYSWPLKTFPLKWFFKGRNADSTLRHKVFYRWLLTIIFFVGLISLFFKPPLEFKQHSNSSTISGYIISGDNVRLRAEARADSEILLNLQIGQKVQILVDEESSWVKIHVYIQEESTIGYIHRDFIDTIK
ncbi:SH3 domain-containing protein [Arsukibacterium sp.]|uniref:SH3 domain-containing protein n=1 Tax=Arsukibacterium sp. TaxID=1977258 RepID=UPI00299EC355|nr:SH3 domain-containing protein [Arsukibacterium sp.]MDX1539601.1 SH3 domain-containing protein [Arsukibacterium sp.]